VFGWCGVVEFAVQPAVVEPVDVSPRPRPSPARLDLAQIFSLIELGRMVWFPPDSVARRHPRPAIAYRTVDDLRPTTFTVIWPQDSRTPSVAAFIRAATAVAAALHPLDHSPGETPAGSSDALLDGLAAERSTR